MLCKLHYLACLVGPGVSVMASETHLFTNGKGTQAPVALVQEFQGPLEPGPSKEVTLRDSSVDRPIESTQHTGSRESPQASQYSGHRNAPDNIFQGVSYQAVHTSPLALVPASQLRSTTRVIELPDLNIPYTPGLEPSSPTPSSTWNEGLPPSPKPASVSSLQSVDKPLGKFNPWEQHVGSPSTTLSDSLQGEQPPSDLMPEFPLSPADHASTWLHPPENLQVWGAKRLRGRAKKRRLVDIGDIREKPKKKFRKDAGSSHAIVTLPAKHKHTTTTADPPADPTNNIEAGTDRSASLFFSIPPELIARLEKAVQSGRKHLIYDEAFVQVLGRKVERGRGLKQKMISRHFISTMKRVIREKSQPEGPRFFFIEESQCSRFLGSFYSRTYAQVRITRNPLARQEAAARRQNTVHRSNIATKKLDDEMHWACDPQGAAILKNDLFAQAKSQYEKIPPGYKTRVTRVIELRKKFLVKAMMINAVILKEPQYVEEEIRHLGLQAIAFYDDIWRRLECDAMGKMSGFKSGLPVSLAEKLKADIKDTINGEFAETSRNAVNWELLFLWMAYCRPTLEVEVKASHDKLIKFFNSLLRLTIL